MRILGNPFTAWCVIHRQEWSQCTDFCSVKTKSWFQHVLGLSALMLKAYQYSRVCGKIGPVNQLDIAKRSKLCGLKISCCE